MDVLTVSQRYDTIFDTHDLGHASSINPGGRSKKRSTTNTSTKRPNKLSMVELRNGVIECGGILEHSGAAISIRLPSRWQLKRRRPRQTPKTLLNEQVTILIEMMSVRKILTDDPLLLMR